MAQKRTKKKASLPGDKITTFELAFMLILAIIKDALDAGLVLAAGIGLILNRITNIFIVAILWFWILYRFHKFPTKRFVGTAIVEFIPMLGTLPGWTAFVISIWLKRKVKFKKTKIKVR